MAVHVRPHVFVLVPLLLLVSVSFAHAQNLLANPSFDAVDTQGRPEHWDLFVMPMQGALGELDASPLGPPFAAKLFIPKEYPQDPANNWSQTIMAEFEGNSLRVSGSIRTDDATEAAIWLQFCRRNPFRVLGAYSNSAASPVRGTREWTSVSFVAEVPENTDFVVVRCVLLGKGTAWFDDLAVERIETEDTEESEESEEAKPEEPSPSVEPAAPDEHANELIEANAALRDALSSMTETNKSLITQIGQLQDELQSLRADIAASTKTVPQPESKPVPPPAEPAPTEVAPPKPKYGHPLVPKGYRESDEQP